MVRTSCNAQSVSKTRVNALMALLRRTGTRATRRNAARWAPALQPHRKSAALRPGHENGVWRTFSPHRHCEGSDLSAEALAKAEAIQSLSAVRLCFAALAMTEDEAAASSSQHHCHSPRKRGIQYAAASRFNHNCLGILDRPVKPGDDRECVAVDTPSRPRGVSPELCLVIPPSKPRGRREDRVPAGTRGPLRENVAQGKPHSSIQV
jgi:hypothetical protein